ncbi:MAG: hypothetical protein LBK53_07360 [Heliobacteriaceae bacterium]|jgi:hypothetical protein|nr:hypothetical protein [Heliobacteriaceae bacterium]
MKKFLLILVMILTVQSCAQAGVFAGKKEMKVYYREVKGVIESQLKYTNEYNLDGLSKLYSPLFINTDGLDKETYFKLIKDTWSTYPNISYTTQIKNIYLNEKYAKVEVWETATGIAVFDTVPGELLSASSSIYYMEKKHDGWLITAEQIIDEKSIIRYGNTRFINMDLSVPSIAASGTYYTAALKVDAPPDIAVIASIGNSKIIYPQVKPEDVFRNLPEDNVLERILLSNKDNTNEYAFASVAIAKPEAYDKSKMAVDGLAFIMTRINVIPENKFMEKDDVK